jgi:hypothetical protein
MNKGWTQFFKKYGRNELYIEGTSNQPIFSYSFDLNYPEHDGRIRFSWENKENDYITAASIRRGRTFPIREMLDTNIWYNTNKPDNYGFSTELFLSVPDNTRSLELAPHSFWQKLQHIFNSHKQLSGIADIDAVYTIYSPIAIEQYREKLAALLQCANGGTMHLTTNYEDAVTTRFYLHLTINKLLTEYAELELLLLRAQELIKALYA